MELVANAPNYRPAVFENIRKLGAEPAIGAGRAGVPARPDHGIAATEAEAEPGILFALRVVGAGRVVGRDVVEQVEDALRAAIGHVVNQDAAAAPRLLRPQDVEIGRVFDPPAGVARRLV